jgi:hypothetical protein
MKKALVLAAVAGICLIPTALRAGDDNPFKKAKVGDWAEYKVTGLPYEARTKMTVVAADDKEVTYEVTASYTSMGKEIETPVQTLKVDLTKDYDPIIAANLKRTGTKIETTGEGTEKVKIGDKEFDTKWTKLKCTTTLNEFTVVSEYKMWLCKDVPLSGLVRMDSTIKDMTTRVELVRSGSK